MTEKQVREDLKKIAKKNRDSENIYERIDYDLRPRKKAPESNLENKHN